MKRRRFLQATGAAFGLTRARGETLVSPPPKGKAEHCVMFWLGGGMAQIDTFDPKKRGDAVGRKPGSYYDSIDTVVPGVQVCEHLSHTAKVMDRVTAIRTVHHDVIDEHAAATNRMHTGRPTSGTTTYPSLGSLVAHERGALLDTVPAYVLLGYPNLTRGPGYLGPKAGYLYTTDIGAGPAGLARPDWLSEKRVGRRERLLDTVRARGRQRFGEDRLFKEYDQAIEESLRLAGPGFSRVFDLDREPSSVRESYGSEFGQRCLLARRLFEAGVRFVEVSYSLNFKNGTGWDTHNEGQKNQHLLIRDVDVALSALIRDLEKRRMLDRTLIIVNTEFGRPADFDSRGGRGHHSRSFSCVLAGGGLKHCGAYGATDERAMNILKNPVSVPDLFATALTSLQVDPGKNLFYGDRPVPVTDGGQPIAALFS
ncbi:MAG: DUF1501 domain-containing protein [Verrucomicrobiota bacterium]